MRTKFNKLLSLLLCLVMVVGMLPTMAFAAEPTDITDYIDSYMIGGKIYTNVSQSNSGDGWSYYVTTDNIPVIQINGYNGGSIYFNLKDNASHVNVMLNVSGTNNVNGLIYAGKHDKLYLRINLTGGAVLNTKKILTQCANHTVGYTGVFINGPSTGEFASVNAITDSGTAIGVDSYFTRFEDKDGGYDIVGHEAYGLLNLSGKVKVTAHSDSNTDEAVYIGYNFRNLFSDRWGRKYITTFTGLTIEEPATLLATNNGASSDMHAIANYAYSYNLPYENVFPYIPEEYEVIDPSGDDDFCANFIYIAPKDNLLSHL